MTESGFAPPSDGAASRPPSPARLVLAVGLLGLGLGDLTVINMVLLPRYLAGPPVGHRATLRSTHRPSAALVTAQPTAGGTARQLVPLPPPSSLPETVAPPAPAVVPPQRLDGAVAPSTPLAIAPSEPPATEEPAPPPADLFPDLHFALNATWLSPSSRATLNQLTEALKQAPQRRVVLRGHADRMGPEELNRALSLARARQARRYMQVRGIAPDRIEIKSFGSRRPADQAVTYAARARNRRVEIEVY